MRVAAVLRNAAAAGSKPKPMSADHTAYHFEPSGFWKKFRDAVVVNPEISSGLPIPTLNRYPQPGSRPERYATPATKASDVAFNPYYKRDVRRSYPQTSVVTQDHLSTLLLASPALASLPAPSTATEIPTNASAVAPLVDNPERAVTASSVPALASVLDKLPAGKSFVGGGLETASRTGLPPLPPPKVGGKWVPAAGDEIPHAPDAYFPMIGYK